MKIDWTYLPGAIKKRMLFEQKQQTGKEDISVFIRSITAGKSKGGFNWIATEAGDHFWGRVLRNADLDMFYEKYPNIKQVTIKLKLNFKHHEEALV
jgi:hypothetical protein